MSLTAERLPARYRRGIDNGGLGGPSKPYMVYRSVVVVGRQFEDEMLEEAGQAQAQQLS